MNKLNIAIITNNKFCFEWQNYTIRELINSNYANVVLKLNYSDRNVVKEKLPILLKYFFKFDYKLFNPKPDALKLVNFSSKFDDLPLCTIDDNQIPENFKKFKIDVIINFTERNVSPELSGLSKHGIWFINHCDLDKINKRPYGIWEMLYNIPEVSGTLRYIKHDMQFPQIIDQTSSCTDSLSRSRNLNDIIWQAQSLIEINLEMLAINEKLFKKKLVANSIISQNKSTTIPFQPPSNLKIIRFVLKTYLKKLIQLISSKFYFYQWIILFIKNDSSNSRYDLKKYKKIVPPKDRFWADPFLVRRNNKYYLFIEELIYKNKLGHLSVMEIDHNGNYTEPKKILEKKYHLSYPFVFEDEGDYYMIPETSGNKDIQLYKCIDFPLKWELEKTLMSNVIAVDTTIHKQNDTYWMFTNIKKNIGGSKHVELFIYSSKKLSSTNWISHPLNPVVKDVKTSRPAGKFFFNYNKLYRPSQNCSYHYGYGLNIIEVIQLSETEYTEDVINFLEPDWDKNVISIHTINSSDNLSVSDALIRRTKF